MKSMMNAFTRYTNRKADNHIVVKETVEIRNRNAEHQMELHTLTPAVLPQNPQSESTKQSTHVAKWHLAKLRTGDVTETQPGND